MKRILVGVMTNNLNGRVQPSTILTGRADALDLQQTPIAPDSYAKLAAAVAAEGQNARADFAAALFWLLENEGWTVTALAAAAGSTAAEEARAAALQEKLERLNDAPIEAVADVVEGLEMARKKFRQGGPDLDNRGAELVDLEIRLEAARIRECLGVIEILHEDYKLWDRGHLATKISHFESLMRADEPPYVGHPEGDFWLADLSRARWLLYRDLFEGFDITAAGWLVPDAAERIVDRIMMRPSSFGAVGIVGPKFYGTGRDRSPMRPRSAIRAVGEVLARAGLALRAQQRRVSQMRPVLVNTNGAKCDTSRQRVYSTVGFADMSDMLRLKQHKQRDPLAFRQKLHLSIRQLQRSLPALMAEVRQTLQRLVDADDGHIEAYC